MSELSLDTLTQEQLEDPAFLLALEEQLDIELCEREFAHFVRQAWRHVDTNELVWNWHMEVICNLLQLVSEGRIKRLIINIPPRMGKTKLCGVLWLAWDWIRTPKRSSIYATYAASLSNKFAKQHRDLVKSIWYQDRWGKDTEKNITIDKENTQKKQEFENNHMGIRFSTGVGGEVTGHGANIILFDDLNKSQHATGKAGIIGSEIQKGVEFLTETLWSRQIPTKVSSNKTAIVGICQRLHHADVAQWCIEQGDFVHLNLPMEGVWDERCFIVEMPDGSFKSALGEEAVEPLLEAGGEIWFEDERENGELLFPEIVTEEEVEDLKRSLGPINASAQLQQKPTPTEGALLHSDWFGQYSVKEKAPLLLDANGKTIISVDATFTESSKSDWVVVQLWRSYQPPRVRGDRAETEYYLIDSIRKRMGIRDTIESIMLLNAKWVGPKKVVVEEAANGYAILEVLKDLTRGRAGLSFDGFKPRTSKEGRVEAISPLVQEGKVFLPVDGDFDIKSLLQEISHFPVGKHDDQVDAMSQALLWFTQFGGGRTIDKLQKINRWYGL